MWAPTSFPGGAALLGRAEENWAFSPQPPVWKATQWRLSFGTVLERVGADRGARLRTLPYPAAGDGEACQCRSLAFPRPKLVRAGLGRGSRACRGESGRGLCSWWRAAGELGRESEVGERWCSAKDWPKTPPTRGARMLAQSAEGPSVVQGPQGCHMNVGCSRGTVSRRAAPPSGPVVASLGLVLSHAASHQIQTPKACGLPAARRHRLLGASRQSQARATVRDVAGSWDL